jgi:uncharacterized membrane protein YoaK (UPF0700 family)
MKREDDYVSGPHDYWIHFWCGLTAGAFAGLWLGWRWFHNWEMWLVSILVSAIFACLSGRWGDKFWTRLLKYWSE